MQLDNVLKSWLTYLCDLVCWTPAEYIVFLEIVHILKTVTPLWPVVSNFLSAKVSPEWRLNLGVGTLKKYPFPLNRGVPSKEITNTKIMWTFFVSLGYKSVPKEKFHCMDWIKQSEPGIGKTWERLYWPRKKLQRGASPFPSSLFRALASFSRT